MKMPNAEFRMIMDGEKNPIKQWRDKDDPKSEWKDVSKKKPPKTWSEKKHDKIERCKHTVDWIKNPNAFD